MQISSFQTKKEAKAWIQSYLESHNKPFKVKKSNKKWYEMKCTDSSCNFTFKVSKIKEEFVVKNFSEHTCSDCFVRSTGKFISSKILPLLTDFNGSLKPKNCVNFLRNEFGLNTTYMNAYRVIKKQKTKSQAEAQERCKFLKPWLEWMTANNSGSVSIYQEKKHLSELSMIEYSFFMPGTSKNAFDFSLPIITLDACHTKGSYKGIIYIATAITGDDKGVMLAYAIAPTECYKYWKIFLNSLNLGLNLQERSNLVIISDREKGLAQAVREEVPKASHSACIYHIENNIKSRFRTDTNGLLWKMAKEKNNDEFKTLMQTLKDTKDQKVYLFLSKIDPSSWARSSFKFPRFGHYTSNVSESINAALGEEFRKKQPFDIMVGLAQKITDSYSKNFEKYSKLPESLYSPKIMKKIEKNRIIARSLEFSSNFLSPQIQIQSEQRSNTFRIFDKITKKCSCGFTDEYGYPCHHIIAVTLRTELKEKDFVIDARKFENIKQVYKGFIYFCDIDCLKKHEVSGVVQMPRRGRPKESSARIISQGELIYKKTITCRTCGQINHNSRTCPLKRDINENH